MILDYVPETEAFVLRIPRREAAKIMSSHGLDMSRSASTPEEAVLFTREPYAALSFHEHATPAAKAVLAPLIAEVVASEAMDSQGHFDIPAGEELWPFQRADLSYGRNREHVLFGDEPGLGKTPQAVVYCNEVRSKRNIAIVPGGIRLQWKRAIERWSTTSDVVVHPVLAGSDGIDPGAHWNVISYELARELSHDILAARPDALIMDEVHYLKSSDALRSKAIWPIAKAARHVVALSGTPMPNRPREVFNIAHHLCPEAIDWMNENAFGDKFNPREVTERWDAVNKRMVVNVQEDTGRHGELQMRLRANFMVRHLKRIVRPELKFPVYSLIQVEKTRVIKEALEHERLLDIDVERLTGRDLSSMGKWSEARRLIGVAIAPQVARYVDMLIDGGEEKLVIFAHHHDVMDILEKAWKKHGIRRVDGRSTSRAKDRAVQEFRNDPGIRLLLGNLLTLGTGTDGLQDVCQHALIAEPSPVPGENVQCFDRLDRGGQRHQVQGEIFVAPGSLLERVLTIAVRKADVTDRALDRKV